MEHTADPHVPFSLLPSPHLTSQPPLSIIMPSSKRQRVSEDDPLTLAIAPPPTESQAEREQRLAAEQEAKRVSDAIDDELNKQRISEKKGPKAIKILLLGALILPFIFIPLTIPTRPERIRRVTYSFLYPPVSSPNSFQANRQL